MLATSPAQPTTACPRCAAPKDPDLWLCATCYVREPFVCAICGVVDALAHGLCATCAAEDAAILDLDPDAPIPFTVSEQGLAELARLAAADRRAEVLADWAHAPEGWWAVA